MVRARVFQLGREPEGNGLDWRPWRPHRLQPQDPAVIAALAAEGGGIAAVDIAPSTAAPGTFEDTASRITVGQRAYRLLQADRRLDIEVVG